MGNRYPFHIEQTAPSLASQLEDAFRALKLLEEMKKSDKPKEDKKPDKASFWKTFVLLGLGTFAMIPIIMWIQFTVFLDILTKAKHLPLP